MKEYQELLEAFEKLKQHIAAYYAYNDYGEQPKLSKEEIEELQKEYENVFKLASTYLEAVPQSSAETEKPFMENADKIQEMLQQDMNALLECKPEMTLPECINYANNKVVNVTGKELDKVGAKTNTRHKMTITGPDGKPIKGFFTERQYSGFNIDNAPHYVEKLSRMYPKCREFFEYAIPKMFAKGDDGKYWTKKNEAELKTKFGKLEGFEDALESIKVMAHSLSKTSEMTTNNISEKNSVSPFETRNIAMSNVAHLLDLDNNIAKSTKLTIRNKGAEIPGCFMEFAKGEDASHPKKDSHVFNMNHSSLDHSPVLKTLSDIQVLDYICGNADRHGYNMFYSFGPDGKLIDVMGIDNDMSFGLTGETMFSTHSGGLNAIFHMSRSMRDKVMNLDKHMLIHALDGLGLDKKNLDFTIERFDALKKKINDGEVIVIEDKDYENYTMYDFTLRKNEPQRGFTYKDKSIDKLPNTSIYGEVAKVTRTLEIDKKKALENPIQSNYKGPQSSGDSDIQLDFDDKNLTLENLQLGTDAPAHTNLLNRINRAGWFISNGSPEFENVKKVFMDIKASTELMGKEESYSSPKNVKALADGYTKLLENCNKYLKHKEDQGKLDAWSWTPTGRRISAVKAVANFCKGKMEVLNKALENTLDKEFVEKKEIREMKNDAQQLMIEGMTKEQVGKYVKDLIQMHADAPDDLKMTVKLGQQLDMCKQYALKQGGMIDDYKITQEDFDKAKTLIQEARLANAEIKKDDITKTKAASKASIMK